MKLVTIPLILCALVLTTTGCTEKTNDLEFGEISSIKAEEVETLEKVQEIAAESEKNDLTVPKIAE